MFFQDIHNLIGYYIAFAAVIAQISYKRFYRDNLLPPPKI
jgi:hypothetical protein